MIRLTGLLLIAVCCSAIGMLASFRLSSRVQTLESCQGFLEALCQELKYTLASTRDLLQHLGERKGFSRLDFLKKAILLGDFMEFPQAWQQALEESNLPLTPEDRRILGQVGDLLGSFDAEGQLSQLAYCQTLLQQQYQQALTEKNTKSQLFRSLGVLSGVGICILLL